MYEVAEESERDPRPALHTSQVKEWDRMEKEVEEDGEERDPSLNTSQEKEEEEKEEDCPSDQEVEVRETEPVPALNTSQGELSDEERDGERPLDVGVVYCRKKAQYGNSGEEHA